MIAQEDMHEDQARRYETFALSLFRLFKLSTIHDLENQAVLRGVAHAEQTFGEIFARELNDLSVLFAGENIFINGQPLKASRATYESVLELGDLLDRVGFNEVRIGRKVAAHDLTKMLSAFVAARRQPSRTSRVQVTERVRMQYVDPSFLLGGEEDELSVDERVARTYTSAVVVMRRVLEAIERGEFRLVNTTKRAAQSLVMLAEQDVGALLGALGAPADQGDRASVAVQGAILAAVMTRLLTRDIKKLSDVTMSAMLFDVGAARLRALGRVDDDPFADGIPVSLTDRELDREPASGAATLAMMSGLYERAVRRCLITHESLWLSRQQRLGAPYRGKISPSLEAVIVEVAHTFQQLLAFDIAAQRPRTPDEALQLLIASSQTRAEKLVIKLLCAALGLYPRGTAVELSSGLGAVVAVNHEQASLYDRPLVFTAERRFIDLAQLDPEILRLGTIERVIARPEGALAAAQRELLTGAVTPPPLEPPRADEAHTVPDADLGDGPSPDLLTLTDQGARRVRLQSILDSSEDARVSISARDLEDDDDELFSRPD